GNHLRFLRPRQHRKCRRGEDDLVSHKFPPGETWRRTIRKCYYIAQPGAYARYTICLMLRLYLLLLAIAPLYAQKPFEFWPGTSYDSKIPTFHQVLGYDAGDRVTSHAGIVRYMEALAAAAPSRLKVFDYGETWEGRKLIYAAGGSEANIRTLTEIRAQMQRIADPRKTPEADARKIMAGLPAVIWLSYGVHGNEISSPDARLLTAYHLLAARNDKLVDEILSHVLVLIDPTQNPHGRDRCVNYFEQARGLPPDSSPPAA